MRRAIGVGTPRDRAETESRDVPRWSLAVGGAKGASRGTCVCAAAAGSPRTVGGLRWGASGDEVAGGEQCGADTEQRGAGGGRDAPPGRRCRREASAGDGEHGERGEEVAADTEEVAGADGGHGDGGEGVDAIA